MKGWVEILWVKRLLWLYFFLLLFEGALRKWVVPSLSNVLLIVRDPVVIAIYALAFRARVFPRNYFMLLGVFVAVFSLAAGIFAPQGTLTVALFGFRANFLHLPLIFVMSRVWTREDAAAVGRWTLAVSLPMAMLMASQFQADSESWINTGAGGGVGGQLEAARGHIRPAGLFSFITGPVFFTSLVTAFIFDSQLCRKRYPWALVMLGALSLIASVIVSGSRSVLGAVAVVVVCAFFAGAVLRPMLMFRWMWAGALLAVIFAAMQNLSLVREGVATLQSRLEDTHQLANGDVVGDILTRAFGDVIVAVSLCFEAPLLGYGLGVGTQAGANLLTGASGFLLSEGEWSRIILESGPILGGAFLLWRLCLVMWLGRLCLTQAIHGNSLPLLIFGVIGMPLLNGNFGQATTLGFTVFCAGLCLAAVNKTAPGPLAAAQSVRVSAQALTAEGFPNEAPGVVSVPISRQGQRPWPPHFNERPIGTAVGDAAASTSPAPELPSHS